MSQLNKCSNCGGHGKVANSVFDTEGDICQICGGTGKDPGVVHHKLGRISSAEYIALLERIGESQRRTARKLTIAQVQYVKKMKGSVSAEVVSRDMNISIMTVRNIWMGKSYRNYEGKKPK